LVLVLVLLALYKLRKTEHMPDPYMVYYDDGLLDIFLGLVLFAAGFGMLADYSAFIGITPALLYPILLVAKKNITAPRLQPDDISQIQVKRRQTRSKMIGLVLALTLALLAGLFVLFVLLVGVKDWQIWAYLMDAGLVIVAGVFVLWGFQSGAKRLVVYGGLLLVARISSFWVEVAFPYYIVAVGGVVSLIGLAIMIRFIQEHPKRSFS
jgi:hypothetical protein